MGRILDALRHRFPDAFFAKIHGGPFQMNGLPDIVGCVEGRFIALEVKLPGEPHPLSRLQDYILDRIDKAGGLTAVVHSVEEAEQCLKT